MSTIVTEALRLLGLGDGQDSSSPELQEITEAQMPGPYRGLLVHDRDMTRTLEDFCGHPVHLRLLHVERIGEEFHRRVLLVSDDGRTVEFGAILIHLQHFDDAARGEILEGRSPLGAILHAHSIEYLCRPLGYLRFHSGGPIHEAFGLPAGTVLFGRVNRIQDGRMRVLAEVIEILPPLEVGGDS